MLINLECDIIFKDLIKGGSGTMVNGVKLCMYKLPMKPYLVPRPHDARKERVWYTSSAFLGAQDAACHDNASFWHNILQQRINRSHEHQ